MQAYIIRPINITIRGRLKSESELLLCALLYFSTETLLPFTNYIPVLFYHLSVF